MLLPLHGYRVPVSSSASVQAKAHYLSQEFERAYTYVTNLLAVVLDVRLAFLSEHDWSSLTQSPYYGAVLYDYPNHTIVAGAEPTSFWQPLVAHLENAAPDLFAQLQQVYQNDEGTIDLSPNIEFWIIHDLGHACHLHHHYWFPRKWLMELFANLCLYSYIVEQAPEHSACALTFFSVLSALPRSLITYQMLADFERQYVALPLNNYLWFSGQLMHLAHNLHQQFGQFSLVRLWDIFVLGNIQEVSNPSLWQQVSSKDAALATMLRTFEQQFD